MGSLAFFHESMRDDILNLPSKKVNRLLYFWPIVPGKLTGNALWDSLYASYIASKVNSSPSLRLVMDPSGFIAKEVLSTSPFRNNVGAART